MKYLYYCNSLYQVITVLKLHLQRKDYGFENIDNYQADLIILNAFAGAEKVHKLIQDEHIFSNVWLVNKNIKTKTNHINSIFNLIAPSFNIRKYGITNVKNEYDVLSFPKFNLICASIWQENKKANLELLDEGVATYIGTVDLQSRSLVYKKLFKLFNSGKDFKDYQKLYVNCIDLIKNTDNRIIEIPKNENINDTLSSIFININNTNNKEILWFSQIFYDESKNRISTKVLSSLEKYKDDLLFCPHPRTPIKSDIFENQIEESLWEINTIKDKDIDNKLLITYHSTACFSPKLLFNKEPFIVLFYSLIEQNMQLDYFVNNFCKLYKNKSKILVPHKIDEIDDFINKYKQE